MIEAFGAGLLIGMLIPEIIVAAAMWHNERKSRR